MVLWKSYIEGPTNTPPHYRYIDQAWNSVVEQGL